MACARRIVVPVLKNSAWMFQTVSTAKEGILITLTVFVYTSHYLDVRLFLFSMEEMRVLEVHVGVNAMNGPRTSTANRYRHGGSETMQEYDCTLKSNRSFLDGRISA